MNLQPIGSSALASMVAHMADTIPYQLFCNVRRVQMLYNGA